MIPRPEFLLGVALALAPVGVAAQKSPIRSAVAGASVVEGTVRDAHTGGPVTEATVTAEGAGLFVQAVSDATGVYRLAILVGHPLDTTVERYGYAKLRMKDVELLPNVRLDFALTPEPVALAPLTVRGLRPPAAAAMGNDGAATPAASRRAAETTLERDRVAPFAGPLQVVTAAHGGGGSGSTPTVGGGATALGMRGYLTRHGATFVDGAPRMLAGPVSFLSDPFRPGSTHVHVWDAGAPARITGGLEYVASIDDLPRATAPGAAWSGSIDLVRSSAAASWRARRLDADVAGLATDPWTSQVVGEGGHRSGTLHAELSTGPWAGQRFVVTGALLHESLPAGPDAPGLRADIDERASSFRWDGSLAGGSLTTGVGASRSSTTLPDPERGVGSGGLALDEDRTYVQAEYRHSLGRSLAMDVGADRLGYRWWGTATGSGATWGAWGEAVYALGERLSVRAGTRIDGHPLGDGVDPAPRVHLDWRVAPGWHVALGSGVYHQVLLEPVLLGSVTDRRPVLARGVHYRLTNSLTVGAVEVRADAWAKRVTGVPGVPGSLDVDGVGLAVDAPVGEGGHLSAAATLERRREAEDTSWSPMIRVQVDRPLPGGLRLQVLVGGSRSAGGLFLGGTALDSVRVLGGGALDASDSPLETWSVVSDAAVGRTIHRSAGGRSLSLYLQILNVLGKESRPLFLESAGLAGARVPRVLVLGLRMGWPPEPGG